ncbi:MAG: acetate--CoA ligase family protein [Chitinivibrionales bacterium]
MSFKTLTRPNSVAIVGASTDPQKVGYAVLENLVSGGYEGKIYPINPKADQIQNIPCFKSLLDVPGEVDLAIVVIKRDLVLSVLKQCAEKGIEAAIVITAGFGETGAEGKKIQEEIKSFVRENNITMMGPNCLGLLNPWHKLNASFGQPLDLPGSIGLFSQSGALVTAIQDWAACNRIGFSILASIGNKATLDEVDFLQDLKEDENTMVIAAYLEQISNGQEFMRVAEQVGKSKPVVILKAGKTSSGAKAASSHTGSLAGSDVAYASAFERSGVIRVESIETLFDVSIALAYQPLPKSDRIAVITNAGGPGIMMTDALELSGLTMAKLSEKTKKELMANLSSAASAHNPVDVLGDAGPEQYAMALEVLLSGDEVDAAIVILTPQKMTEDKEIAKRIVEISKKYDKPVFSCFMGADIVGGGVKILQENKIPQYPIPERAARAMLEMVNYARYKNRPLRVVERFSVNKNPVHKIFRSYRERGMYEIGEADAKAIMNAYNFTVPPGILASNAHEAVRFGEEVGYPLAMKISSPDILHKSDVGGVKIGLSKASEVEDAYELMMLRIGRKMPHAELRGVVVEKMVTGGREVIVGMKKDPQFGPMLMFGLGGIFVEVLKDVTFSLAPITADEAYEMIRRTKTYKLLAGARGQKPVDIPAIVENLLRMSQLVMDFPEIEEIDINPLKVGFEGDGAFVVDARVIISKE